MKRLSVCCTLLATIGFLAQSAKFSTTVYPAKQPIGVFSDSLLTGAQLAARYCVLCHLFPEPSLLDKRTWVEKVLPNMALRLGIRENGKDPYADLLPEEQPILRKLNVYPEEQMLPEKEWKQIVQYYEDEAPLQPVPQVKHAPIMSIQGIFEVKQLTFEDKPMPRISMLKYDQATTQLYVGDAQQLLYILNNRFEFKSAWTLESPPVAADFPEDGLPRLLTIGDFNPSDLSHGRFFSFDTTGKANNEAIVNIPSLPRPVDFACADLNMDGKEDVIVAGFGNHIGKLSWYDHFQPDQENILKALPGATKVEVCDFNADGRPDIIAMMAQAWEGISVFYNEGGGTFKERKILQFHPAFGSNYFELVDFNNDGHLDILMTNGDNWDYSRIHKNYHGVRIYLNNGADNFKEDWFFPLYGASKAMARDFDGDGDLDIAVTSFYVDNGQLENGFVYFSNHGSGDFHPYSLPDAVAGKWLTMEVADFDDDGDQDIVLGSYLHNLTELGQFAPYGLSKFPQLLVLTNQTVK